MSPNWNLGKKNPSQLFSLLFALILLHTLFTVQWTETQVYLGDVAPHPGGGSPVCHRQHLQLPAPRLPLHCQLPPGPPADLSGPNAAGHPQVPLHLLPGAAGLRQRPQPALLLLRDQRHTMQGHPLQSAEQRFLNVRSLQQGLHRS